MRVVELKAQLEAQGFCCLQNLRKSQLEELVRAFDATGLVPMRYRERRYAGEPCVADAQCATQHCADDEGVCIDAHTFARQSEDACLRYPPQLNLALQDHQKAVAKFMRQTQQKGLVVVHNVGSGKTITALTIARCLLQQRRDVQRAVILAPVSIVPQWKHWRDQLQLPADKVHIASHVSWLRQFSKNAAHARDAILIIDEAHKLRSTIRYNEATQKWTGKLSKWMVDAAAQASKVVFLTATPLINDIRDLRNMMTAIDGHADYLEGYQAFKEHMKSRTLPDLFRCKFSYRSTLNPQDFPNVTEHLQVFRMSPSYYRKYMVVETRQTHLLDETSRPMFKSLKEVDSFMSNLRRAANAVGLYDHSPKITWTVQQLKRWAGDQERQKALVYSGWRSTGTELLQKRLADAKVPAEEIHGGLTPSQRQEIVSRFNRGDLRVIIITSAGAEGIDLKQTRHVVVLEPYWNMARITQVIGRAARFRSHEALEDPKDRTVDVWMLQLRKPEAQENDLLPSSDEIMMNLAKMKQDRISQSDMMDVIRSSIEQNLTCR
jgi:superfamily II DNA or RNA helicase